MIVAVYGRDFDPKFNPYVKAIFKKLNDLGITTIVYDRFYSRLKRKEVLAKDYKIFATHDEIKNETKFLISIGGDGTLLDATTFVRDTNIGVIGINTGRLGFLSGIGINEIDKAFDQIFAGEYDLDSRTLLKLETNNKFFGNNNFALNEITVLKNDTSAMITIHTYMDGLFLNSYWADGLIISTPTGSTAYSLSCGGPIILPGSNNFEITPIAPHNLNVRPIVIPDDKEITLKIEGRIDQFLVSLDSRYETIGIENELKISKNNFAINLVRLKGDNPLNTIRTKLNWGLDKRN